MKVIKLKKVEKAYSYPFINNVFILYITTEESGDDNVLIKGELYCGKRHDRNIAITCSLDEAKEKLDNLVKTYIDIGYEIVKEDEEKSDTLSLEDIFAGNF